MIAANENTSIKEKLLRTIILSLISSEIAFIGAELDIIIETIFKSIVDK